MRIFPAFFDRPSNIAFSEQERGEYIELLLRQHWITNVPWILLSIIGYFIPFLAIKYSLFLSTIISVKIPDNILVAFLILWYLFLLGYIINRFLYWYFNIYIVTNKHLVDITLNSLLLSTVTSSEFSDVQSTRYQFVGILGPLFRYGNVVVETAAKDQRIQFIKVPKPDLVAERIEDLEGATHQGGVES